MKNSVKLELELVGDFTGLKQKNLLFS